MEGAFLWNNWLLLAWAAPLAWGLGSLVDVLMIEQRVYRRSDSGNSNLVTGRLCAVPDIRIAGDRSRKPGYTGVHSRHARRNQLSVHAAVLLQGHVHGQRRGACGILPQPGSPVRSAAGFYPAARAAAQRTLSRYRSGSTRSPGPERPTREILFKPQSIDRFAAGLGLRIFLQSGDTGSTYSH